MNLKTTNRIPGQPVKLIVGLGNPGQKYEGTRHNVGFEVIAELARRYNVQRPKSKFHGEIAEVYIKNTKTVLLSPLTYMNLSGQSVREALEFFKLPLDDVLVICDDLNLPTARLRMRSSGSAGGQNGIKDIIRQLGDQQFARLRIGIDRPPPGWETANYVLGKFSPEDLVAVEKSVKRAADAAEVWVADGVQMAMNKFNSDPDQVQKKQVKKKQASSNQGPENRPQKASATSAALGNEDEFKAETTENNSNDDNSEKPGISNNNDDKNRPEKQRPKSDD